MKNLKEKKDEYLSLKKVCGLNAIYDIDGNLRGNVYLRVN